MGTAGWYEPCDGSPMLRDLDLGARSDLVEQHEELRFDLGSGHLSGHMATVRSDTFVDEGAVGQLLEVLEVFGWGVDTP